MESKRVLIVEDDPDVAAGLQARLSQEFATEVAIDGISAISTGRRQRPHAIILDLGLPAGDGFAVLEWLKGVPELAATPVIVYTARPGADEHDRALAAGAREVLRKPARGNEIVDAVRRCTTDTEVGTALPERQSSERQRSESRRSALSILVVDDDEDLRAGLCARLRASEYAVLEAADAVAAVTLAQQKKPDLILLDLGLPAGGGELVIERLQMVAETRDIPIIVVSGRSQDEALRGTVATGADYYLEKPIRQDELFEAIAAVK